MPVGKTLNIDMTMKEIMDTWPITIKVVLRKQMACVGCPISDFHTLVDAANEHFIEPEEFEAELRTAIAGAEDEVAD